MVSAILLAFLLFRLTFTMSDPVVEGYVRGSPEYELFLESEYGRHSGILSAKDNEIADLKKELRKKQSDPTILGAVGGQVSLQNVFDKLQSLQNDLDAIKAGHHGAGAPSAVGSPQAQSPVVSASSPSPGTPTAAQAAQAVNSSLQAPSAAALVAQHPAQALRNVLISDNNGNSLLPAYHISMRKSVDFSKFNSSQMTLVELIHGWGCVAKFIVANGGDIDSYVNHLHFTTEMCLNGNYSHKAAIKYDEYIMRQFISGGQENFEHNATGSTLHFQASNSFKREGGRGGR